MASRFRRQNRKNEIRISMADVDLILGSAYGPLVKFLESTFCPHCEDRTTITDFVSYLDDTNDVILEGKCIHCGNVVARYIETGESAKSSGMAKHIRRINDLLTSIRSDESNQR